MYGILTAIAIFFVRERIPVVKSRLSRQKRAAKIDWIFLRTRNFIAFTSMIALTSWGSFLPALYIPSFGKVRPPKKEPLMVANSRAADPDAHRD